MFYVKYASAKLLKNNKKRLLLIKMRMTEERKLIERMCKGLAKWKMIFKIEHTQKHMKDY